MEQKIVTIEEAYLSHKFVIVDTETTGLRRPAEICQIAILDFMGDILLESYVQTKKPIPPEVTAIHNITDDMVAGAPTWPDLKPVVLELFKGKYVITYNATYDRHMMHCSDDMWGLPATDYKADSPWLCAMLWYADIHGEWDSYHGNNRWQKLSVASQQMSLPVIDAHDAYGDAIMTYNLISRIMRDRAAAQLVYSETGNTECEHKLIDDTMNGDRVCRDCGKTWTV